VAQLSQGGTLFQRLKDHLDLEFSIEAATGLFCAYNSKDLKF
jgi:hypothetical protein